jgi:hypothetical protein
MDEAEIVNQPFLIGFEQENSAEDLKQLRAHVINTIKLAKNFTGSKIESQLAEKKVPAKTAAPVAAVVKPLPKVVKPAAVKAVVASDDEPDADFNDGDLPF